jgi:cytochrome b involved in lipid metabolism
MMRGFASLLLLPLWVKAFAPASIRSSTKSLSNHQVQRYPSFSQGVRPLFYQNNATTPAGIHLPASKRFERIANDKTEAEKPCILTIEGVRYNVTAWAKAHPGGLKVLERFHNKDATKAFLAADHSQAAIDMLKDFAMDDVNEEALGNLVSKKQVPRWKAKLFTKEDPIGVHKSLGIFCVLHFTFRFFQMYFTDISAGLGTRMGRGPSWLPVVCLLPHGLLSVSSLIFHTVPKARVVGKPMIWQEYRVHNILFGLRSVITAALCAMAIQLGNGPTVRRIAIWGSCVAVLAAQVGADLGTKYLRSNDAESTTATMPYWEGCSMETQKSFKSFYAYSQFVATIACFTCLNPAWPLSVLLAIQVASLLMTLVRKGLISARGYHYGYTATLIAPYIMALRNMFYMGTLEMPFIMALGGLVYSLRRRGVNKYRLWVPLLAARIAVGDTHLSWQIW